MPTTPHFFCCPHPLPGLSCPQGWCLQDTPTLHKLMPTTSLLPPSLPLPMFPIIPVSQFPRSCHSAEEKPYIASMGIYVMKANALKELLEQHMPDANDFGNEVIPGARKLGYPVQVRRF